MVSTIALQNYATQFRRDVLEMTAAAGSGHPTTCLSMAELMSVLFLSEMRYDIKHPDNPDNDQCVLSKGHAAPILYSALKHAGATDSDLMTLRQRGSSLEGHPVPSTFPWVKVATGSLGQGLSVGVGLALASRYQQRHNHVYVVLGDSELSEGSNYEALQLAAHLKLQNLVAIVDVNRLGQRGPTIPEHDLRTYAERFDSFGWAVRIIDGHNISAIQKSLSWAKKQRGPAAILAKTLKGKGVTFLQDKEGWHGKVVSSGQLGTALAQLPAPFLHHVRIKPPKKTRSYHPRLKKPFLTPYEPGELVATRKAYGNALMQLAMANEHVLVLDAETSNSTGAAAVKKHTPGQFVECYIAEQNMVGMATGLAAQGMIPFVSSFAAFLTRAHDQLRMGALSSAKFTVCGSHAGVEIGQDGSSQMALDDISMMRGLYGSSVFYPADAIATEKLVWEATQQKGISYLRTTRGARPVIYDPQEAFPAGEFKVLRKSTRDKVVLVGAGVTLHESLLAADQLKKKRTSVAVVDMYSIKPFNTGKFLSFVQKHGKRVVVTEDHFASGGIGELIQGALTGTGIPVKHLCVQEMPHSSTPEELLRDHKIDAAAIVKAATGKW